MTGVGRGWRWRRGIWDCGLWIWNLGFGIVDCGLWIWDLGLGDFGGRWAFAVSGGWRIRLGSGSWLADG